MNYKKIIGISTVFIILSIIILVSATNTNDTGDSKKYTDNGITYDITTTPYRQDNTGYITVEINSNSSVNKTFTIQDNNKNISLSLKDNTSSITNTSQFIIPSNGVNKTLTITDNENNKTINLTNEFTEKNKLSLFDDSKIISISGNASIQEAINNASEKNINIIELNGSFEQHDIKVNKSNLTIISGDNPAIINGEGLGRGFIVNESNITFNRLTITNTSISDEDDGAGIYFNSSSSNSVINCTLTNNTATGNGGGIYFSGSNGNSVSDCTLTNNTAASDGGGIYFSGSNGNSVSDCNLTYNTANGGGGILFIGSSSNNVSGCNLTYNTANGGGGIFFSDSSNNGISGCTLTNNRADGDDTTGGGGIHFWVSNGNSVSDCTLTNNTANGGGGILFIGSSSNSVSGCNLTYNTANGGGGIFFGASLNSGSTDNNVSGCNLTNNTATSDGGGIYFYGNSNDNSVSDSTLTNNNANNGGGMYFSSSNNNSVSDSTLTNNNATGDGGGMYFWNSGSNNVSDSTLTNNIANTGNGGGIYFETVLKISSSNNIISGCNLTNNEANSGGGISFSGSSSNNVSDSTLTNNIANTGDGGGMYFNSSSSNSVSDSTLTNNNATGDGGGMYFWNSSSNSVSDCTLTYNTATSDGGGISFDNSGGNNVSDCTLTNNTANTPNTGDGGGGIYFDNSNDNNVSGCTLTYNTANFGGGISLDTSNNNINYNRFYNNNANNGMDIVIGGNKNNIATSDDMNVNTATKSNISYNWWGNNNPNDEQIVAPDGLLDNFYQVQLRADDLTFFNNSTYNGSLPISVGYRLVLNDTNDSSTASNLPGFNVTIDPNANLLSRGLQLHSSGNSITRDARNNWSDSINDEGNFVLRALVDNEDLSLDITSKDDRIPTSLTLSLSSNSIILGDSVTLTAKLTNSSGGPIPNANVTFNINGINYTINTTVDGIATYSFKPDHVGEYNITATFKGNETYRGSNSTSKILAVKSSTSQESNSEGNNGLPGFGNGLRNTGFPLIILLVLSVTGLLYWRKK
jgi:parallel beta-helix repeat protein